MKVLAVITYKKYVVLDVPDVTEPEIDQSRQPDWEARHGIIKLADEKAKDALLDKEDKDGTDTGDVVDGINFEADEWFDH